MTKFDSPLCHALSQNQSDPHSWRQNLAMRRISKVLSPMKTTVSWDLYHRKSKRSCGEFSLLQRIQYSEYMAKRGYIAFSECLILHSFEHSPHPQLVSQTVTKHVSPPSPLVREVIFTWPLTGIQWRKKGYIYQKVSNKRVSFHWVFHPNCWLFFNFIETKYTFFNKKAFFDRILKLSRFFHDFSIKIFSLQRFWSCDIVRMCIKGQWKSCM